MYISQIEINHFKSFAGQTIIPFKTGFTTISGPNGSGKSNILDAILFCLGLSTSRTLRADKLGDLISTHSAKREASVIITFTVPGQADTVSVGRRIKEASKGNYTSTYTLNGKVHTLSEIHDYLSQYNVSPGCYNVMMQGDVSGIVNMGGVERRKILDEMAGVAEFDRKIDQAQAELAVTGNNIEHHGVLLEELQARLAELMGEREHALKYQALKTDCEAKQTQLELAGYWDILKHISLTQEQQLRVESQKQQQQDTLRNTQEQSRIAQAVLEELQAQIQQKSEDEHMALYRQLENFRSQHGQRQHQKEALKTQQAEADAQVSTITQAIERHQDNIGLLGSELEGFVHQQQECEAHLAAAQENLARLEAQREAWGDSEEAQLSQLLQLKARRQELADELASLKRQQLDIEASIQRASQSQEKHGQLSGEASRLNATLSQHQSVLAAVQHELEQRQRETFEARTALQHVQAKVTDLERAVIKLESQKQAYESMHTSGAVEVVMKSGLDGVHGTLSQLGAVAPEYAYAVEIAMGGRVNNIVVDHAGVAEQCIDVLKEAKRGRATFLPLAQLVDRNGRLSLPRANGVVDFAVNLMEFDPRFEAAFKHALGDTLVVEDIVAARPLLRKYRMVTLDGSLLEKSGAMTGGATHTSGQAKRSAFAASTGVVDAELNQYKARFKAADSEKRQLEKHLQRLESQLEALKTQRMQAEQQQLKLALQLESVQGQVGALSVDAGDTPLPYLQQQHQQLVSDIQTQQALLAQCDEALSENQPTEDTAQNPLEALKSGIADARFQQAHYEAQLRNTLTDIKNKELERQYQQTAITDYQARLQELAQKQAGWQSQQNALQEECEALATQIQTLQQQTELLDGELKALQTERQKAQEQVLAAEKAMAKEERQLALLEEQVVSLKQRLQQLQSDRLADRDRLLELGLEVSVLEGAIPTDFPAKDELEAAIKKLQQKMRALEPVNMLAIAAYDEVALRVTELGDKIATLHAERESLLAKIASYHDLKLTTFRETFQQVDGYFKQIFAELSDGVGQLLLTNIDNPFEGGLTIQASPRAKKMQRLEAMSGGEKSLTSLAFMFALQRTQPAPFYALDEVDMNLDGINAEKLANMVKRESSHAQFVVVSLRKPMIERADRTVGVTQRRSGSSKVVGVEFPGLVLEEVS